MQTQPIRGLIASAARTLPFSAACARHLKCWIFMEVRCLTAANAANAANAASVIARTRASTRKRRWSVSRQHDLEKLNDGTGRTPVRHYFEFLG
jgi:hypothetical protein